MDPLVLKGSAPSGSVQLGDQPIFSGGIPGGTGVIGNLGAGGAVVRMDSLVLKGSAASGSVQLGDQPQFGGVANGTGVIGNLGAGGSVVRMDPLVLKGSASGGSVQLGDQPQFGGVANGTGVIGNLGAGGSVVRMDPMVLKGSASSGSIQLGDQAQFGGVPNGTGVIGNLGAGGSVVRMDPLVLKGSASAGSASSGSVLQQGAQPQFGENVPGQTQALDLGQKIITYPHHVVTPPSQNLDIGCPDCGIELVQVIPRSGNNPMNTTDPTAGGSTIPAITLAPAAPGVDVTPPTVTPPAAITVAATSLAGIPNTDPAIAAFLNGATATDNVGVVGAITNDAPANIPLLPVNTLPPVLGSTTLVTFSARDAAGNVGTNISTITVVDNQAPVIANVPAPATVMVQFMAISGSAPAGFLTQPTATDNIDGVVAVTHDPIWDAPNAFPIGPTQVIFAASDSVGNNSQATTTVTVQNVASCTVGPVATTVPVDFSYIINSGQCEAAVTQSAPFAANGAPVFQVTPEVAPGPGNPTGTPASLAVTSPNWTLVSATTGTFTPGSAGVGSLTKAADNPPSIVTMQCLANCLSPAPAIYTFQLLGGAGSVEIAGFE
jgi:hypothetical protein